MILDGGPCQLGIEFDGGRACSRRPPGLLRPGALPARGDRAGAGRATCCGKANHRGRFARTARNPLCARTRRSGSPRRIVAAARRCSPSGLSAPAGARVTINLSPSGNLEEAAAKLFAALRELDRYGRHGNRRDADSRPRARRGHQRPLAARRQSALALILMTREPSNISRRARTPSMRWSASSARRTPFATRRPWRLISSNGATAIAARPRSCSSPAKRERSRRS